MSDHAVSTPPADGGGAAPVVTTPTDPGQQSTQGRWFDSFVATDPNAWNDHVPHLAQFKDPLAFVTSAKQAHTAARAKVEGMVKLPGEDATPEDIAAFHKSLGVPDTIDGYGLTKPEKLPDGVQWNDEAATSYLAKAKEIGLTPQQAAALRDWQVELFGKDAASQIAQQAEMAKAEKAALNERFGKNLDASVALAQRLAVSEGLPATVADPNSPDFWGVEFLSFAHRLAGKVGESKLVSLPAVSQLDPAAQADDIIKNPQNPYHARYQQGDKEIAAMVKGLYQRAG